MLTILLHLFSWHSCGFSLIFSFFYFQQSNRDPRNKTQKKNHDIDVGSETDCFVGPWSFTFRNAKNCAIKHEQNHNEIFSSRLKQNHYEVEMRIKSMSNKKKITLNGQTLGSIIAESCFVISKCNGLLHFLFDSSFYCNGNALIFFFNWLHYQTRSLKIIICRILRKQWQLIYFESTCIDWTIDWMIFGHYIDSICHFQTDFFYNRSRETKRGE